MLNGEIAAMVLDGLEGAGLPYDVTVTRSAPGSTTAPYTPWNPGPPTTVAHPCRGFVDDYTARERDGTVIQANDRKVVVLAPSRATRLRRGVRRSA